MSSPKAKFARKGAAFFHGGFLGAEEFL